MDETIRINFVSRNKWHKIIQGFQSEQIEQILEVRYPNGTVAGIICESQEGLFYLNGKPDVNYRSLQAAAEALIKCKASA
ncbi:MULTISPECIES: hypothetical protein [unclassified Coleofasciculus]|uniref:hypothetical protein n=1 Tax=unclassified Coleofasciculus TaxID=2692782 RepID=UPI001882C1BD|nr:MULTISPECIES: hypothetical protein [unclassified Coleofasciculus]MBE9125639.1 hypothetical protein [Coleofasciculus sp. LEGE 07081]MBE9148793.1 hypothetical protein [Coleofasciculus sp. LEGE 07092]